MADASTISVLIKARDMASDAFQRVENNAGRMAGGIAKHRRAIGMGMTAMGGAMTGFAVLTVKAASDLEESMNAVNVIFTDGAKVIHKFGENSARSVGLSTAKFNELASVTGALLKDVGLPMEEVAGLTTDLAIRAADMASVMNTSVEDALSAVGQALRGETEAIRRYAGDVTDASLQNFALSEGIQKQVSEMTEQEKRLLRVSLIMEQTSNMAGDFANTSESLANRMRIAKAEFANVSAELGTALLPLVTQMVAKIQAVIIVVADWIKEHPELAKQLMIAAAAVGALMLVLGPLLLILPGLALGFTLLSASMGPITAIVMGLTAAILIGIKVWRNWDSIVNAVKKTLAFFAQSTLDMARDVLVAIKAVADFIPGLKGTENALQGAIDKLDDMSVGVDRWANNTEGKLREQSLAWGAMEDSYATNADEMQAHMEGTSLVSERTGDAIVAESQRISTAAEDMARDSGIAWEDMAIESGNAWGAIQDDWIEAEKAMQESAQRNADSVAYFAKLNLDTEREARNESRENFLKDIEDNLAAAARQQEEKARILEREAQDVERAADRKADAEQRALDRQLSSWERFQQDQHPIMQALDDRNMRFGDVLAELAKDSGLSLGEMGQEVKKAGVTWGDTFALINSAVASNLESILATIETTGAKAAAKAVGLPVVAAAALDTGAGMPGAHIGGGSITSDQLDLAVERWNAAMPHSPVSENTLKTMENVQKFGGDFADLGGRFTDIIEGIPGRPDTGIQGFARGGRVGRGGMALVGERGAELVSLPGGSTVHPNGTGPGGGVTNQFHFHGAVYGVEDLKEAVVEAVRDHAISGGFSGVFAEA